MYPRFPLLSAAFFAILLPNCYPAGIRQMEQIKLSKSVLERLAANRPAKRTDYRTDLPSCYLRVGPSSMSLTVLKRDINQKQVRVSIALDPLNLPNLPELKRVVRLAKDEATPERRRVSKLRTSLSAAGEVVIESKRLAPSTERNYLRSLRHLVAATDDRVVSKGTEIRNLHKILAVEHGNAGANSALKLLRSIMKTMHADDLDFPDWPTDGVKGLWAYEPPRETKLSMEQLPIVWEAALPDHWGSWLRFALLTGMRKSETQRAFVQGDELVVENTKNHSNLRLPMTDAIEACFFDYSQISCFKPLTKHLFAETEIRATPHDLRRTFANVARIAGVQQNTLSWLMNHRSSRSDQTSSYQGRPEPFLLREALTAIETVYRRAGCAR